MNMTEGRIIYSITMTIHTGIKYRAILIMKKGN